MTPAKTIEIALPEVNNDGLFTDIVFLDLSKEKDRLLLRAMVDSGAWGEYRYALEQQCMLNEFLKTGEYTISCGKSYVVTYYEDAFYIVHKDMLFPTAENDDVFCDRDPHAVVRNATEGIPAAVLLHQRPKCTVKPRKNADTPHYYVLLNADDSVENARWNDEEMGIEIDRPESSLVGLDDFEDAPCISFTCVSRFQDVHVLNAAKRLANCEIELVEFTPDETKNLTQKQIEAYDNERKMPPSPGPGYTLMSTYWHRPSSVVMYDATNDITMLFGQDDDSYFGVELPVKARSIAKAFECLAPKVVKDAIASKVVVTRQGEWYAIARTEEEVVPMTEAVLCFRTDSGDYNDEEDFVSLNRDHADASHHIIRTSDGRIGPDGTVYAYCPRLVHSNEDHPDMYSHGWVSYHRNTALRSFSVEGVD